MKKWKDYVYPWMDMLRKYREWSLSKSNFVILLDMPMILVITPIIILLNRLERVLVLPVEWSEREYPKNIALKTMKYIVIAILFITTILPYTFTLGLPKVIYNIIQDRRIKKNMDNTIPRCSCTYTTVFNCPRHGLEFNEIHLDHHFNDGFINGKMRKHKII